MTRILSILSIIMLAVACKPGVPKDIIQPEKMEKILLDIHVADAYASFLANQDSAKKVVPPIYKGIYQKYGIDSAMQAKSMDYYYKHPDILNGMYERISSRLLKAKENEQERLNKEMKALEAKQLKEAEKQRKKDSLQKLSDTLGKKKSTRKDSLLKTAPIKKINRKNLKKIKTVPLEDVK